MTVTTVGYGDIVPVTPIGKIIAGVVTISGVLVLALPSAIMATGFIEERERYKNSTKEGTDPEKKRIMIEKLNVLKDEGHITEQEYDLFRSEIS